MKSCLIFIAVFFVLYLETEIFFGIKFSHLWKGSVATCLILYIIMRTIKYRASLSFPFPYFISAGYAYSLWPLVVMILHENPVNSLFVTAQRIMPVVAFHYLFVAHRDKIKKIHRAAIVFVLLSSIPFAVGLLEQKGSYYDLEKIGDVTGGSFVGLFQTSHVASLTFALCLIASICYASTSNDRKTFIIWGAVSPPLFYLLIMSYARSGIFSFLGGLLVLIFAQRRFTGSVKILFVASIGVLVFSMTVPNYENLISRFYGKTVYTKDENYDLNRFSSGRLMLWAASAEIFVDAGLPGWVGGLGEAKFHEEMKKRVGVSLFAHNGFLDEIMLNGLVGAAIFFNLLIAMYKDIIRITADYDRILGLSSFAAYVVFTFFQGFNAPLQLLLLSPYMMIGYNPRLRGD